MVEVNTKKKIKIEYKRLKITYIENIRIIKYVENDWARHKYQ